MRSLIVCGPREGREDYITRYINKHSVPQHLTISFDSPVKISDVRRLKKMLQSSLSSVERRLVILNTPVLSESQHALLKIVEELPTQTGIIFSADRSEQLLPTLRSRCHIVRLTHQEQEKNDDYLFRLIRAKDEFSRLSAAFLYTDYLIQHSAEESVTMLEESISRLFRDEKLTIDQKKNLLIMSHNICHTSSYIIHNNLNLRIAFEDIFLSV